MNDPAVSKDLIEEEDIVRLVDGFYGKVRRDPTLGPIFNSVIADWPTHLAKMYDFWSMLMLGTRRFEGRPMPKHQALADRVQPDDFQVWLGLFRETARELFQPAIADAFINRAEVIAPTLSAGMFGKPFNA